MPGYTINRFTCRCSQPRPGKSIWDWSITSCGEENLRMMKIYRWILISYWQYVLGKTGSEKFNVNDQMNIAGDQFGTYQLEVIKQFEKITGTFYLSHPFEDASGLNWRNWPDNLLGLHVKLKNNVWLTDVVYEYTNTRQQSVGKWKSRLNDNYFWHGIYQSGYTYHQQVMASPLFFPLVVENGRVTGYASNRFYAHHIGGSGFVTNHLQWKSLLTWINHFGTYMYPYETVHRQLSGLFELQYNNPSFPVELGASIAADAGNTGKNVGVQIWIGKSW